MSVANGILVRAHGVGQVLCQSDINGNTVKIALKDVWYVPDLVHSLLSLRQLGRCGCYHIGGAGKITFFDKTMQPILVCTEYDNSYVQVWSVYMKPGKALSTHTQQQTAELWHTRFVHTNYNALSEMVDRGLVTGIDVPATKFRESNAHTCEVCVMGKFAAKPYKAKDKTATCPMALLHMDMAGPYEVPSFSGAKFAIGMLDEHTSFADAMCVKTKAEAKFWIMKTIKAWETKSGYKCQRVKCDRGGEFLNKLLKEFYALNGIVMDFTPGYCHQSNGKAERLMRTMNGKVRCILYHCMFNHPQRNKFWAEALRYAMYIRKCTLLRDQPATPMELFEGKVPDVSKLRTFGCKAFAKVLLELRHKLDPRCHIGMYLGNERDTDGHRVLVIDNNGKATVRIVRDVVTMETLTHPSVVQSCEPNVCPICNGANQYKESLPSVPQELLLSHPHPMLPSGVGGNGPMVYTRCPQGAATPEQPQGFADPGSAVEQQEAAGLQEAAGQEAVGLRARQLVLGVLELLVLTSSGWVLKYKMGLEQDGGTAVRAGPSRLSAAAEGAPGHGTSDWHKCTGKWSSCKHWSSGSWSYSSSVMDAPPSKRVRFAPVRFSNDPHMFLPPKVSGSKGKGKARYCARALAIAMDDALTKLLCHSLMNKQWHVSTLNIGKVQCLQGVQLSY